MNPVITIVLPCELDQEQMASTLHQISLVLRHSKSLEDQELMDGSIRIDTPHGPAYLTLETE